MKKCNAIVSKITLPITGCIFLYCICAFYMCTMLLPIEKYMIYTTMSVCSIYAITRISFHKTDCMVLLHTVLFIMLYNVVTKSLYWWYLVESNHIVIYCVLIALLLLLTIILFIQRKEDLREFFSLRSLWIYCIILVVMYIPCFQPIGSSPDTKIMDQYYKNDCFLASVDKGIVVIDENGCTTYGLDKKESNYIRKWNNVIKVDGFGNDIYGLTKDGRVLYCGNDKTIQNEVNSWKGIKEIAAGDDYVVALGSRILVAGDRRNYEGIEDNVNVEAIKEIETVGPDIILLMNDGSISIHGSSSPVSDFYDETKWKNIRHISGGSTHLLGITDRGKVLTIGENFSGQCAVNGMKNIVYGYAGERNTILITKNGNIIAVGENSKALEELMTLSGVGSVTDGINFVYAETEKGNWCSAEYF